MLFGNSSLTATTAEPEREGGEDGGDDGGNGNNAASVATPAGGAPCVRVSSTTAAAVSARLRNTLMAVSIKRVMPMDMMTPLKNTDSS